MQKGTRSGKAALQKALKDRLERLTLSLGEAQVGDKGIELIKEMKELCTLLENADTSRIKSIKQEASAVPMVFTWAAPSHAVKQEQKRDDT